jgi:hypothetical protein
MVLWLTDQLLQKVQTYAVWCSNFVTGSHKHTIFLLKSLTTCEACSRANLGLHLDIVVL